MKGLLFFLTALATLMVTSCSTSQEITIPLSESVELDDTYTIIWNGISKAYRYEGGKWLRAESYDYQFDVVQNDMTRYGSR
jgi:hypothetical protein